MTFFLFVDESGNDHQESPYEVIAGVAIKDRNLWNLIQEVKEIEKKLFGDFYSTNKVELKAKKLLNAKTFRLACQKARINNDDLPTLAQECLHNGEKATRLQLTALGQAKILYATQAIQACSDAGGKVFASIIDYDAVATQPDLADVSGLPFLRKDYSYLFERFYYYLEDLGSNDMGVIVFDELDKAKSHLLLGQMTEYFINTRKGQERSSLIIPEPFFVHSDLTVGVQIVDLAAYILNWRFRTGRMIKPSRAELQPQVNLLCNMRVLSKRTITAISGDPVDIWSIALIDH
jgi:hypothetical protein